MKETVNYYIIKRYKLNNYLMKWKNANLFGSGAVNAIMEGRWFKTPAKNSSPILDIPYWEGSLDAIKTFSPFSHRLMWTCDPDPMSSRLYLHKIRGFVIWLRGPQEKGHNGYLILDWVEWRKVICIVLSGYGFCSVEMNGRSITQELTV